MGFPKKVGESCAREVQRTADTNLILFDAGGPACFFVFFSPQKKDNVIGLRVVGPSFEVVFGVFRATMRLRIAFNVRLRVSCPRSVFDAVLMMIFICT